VWLVPFSELNS
jgi:hypothetical protein